MRVTESAFAKPEVVTVPCREGRPVDSTQVMLAIAVALGLLSTALAFG
jgi:hypothetical protein